MSRFIPLHLSSLRGLGLKANDKILYEIMRNDYPFYMKNKGIYTPSIAHLQEEMEVSRMTVVNGLKLLEKIGLLTSHPRPKGLTTSFVVKDITKVKIPEAIPAQPNPSFIDSEIDFGSPISMEEIEENPF